MPHSGPTSVTFRKLDDPRRVEMTFFGPTWNGGASAIFPKEDAIHWFERWVESRDHSEFPPTYGTTGE